MIGPVLKSVFTTDATLFSLFAGRVYPFIAAQGAAAPYVVYDIFRLDPQGSKDQDSHIDETSVRLTVVAPLYSTCQSGVEAMRSAFVRTSRTVAGTNVQSCTFETQRDIYSDSDEYFGVQADFTFRIVKP